MFTLYWIAIPLARKPNQIWLLFTHKNGDFGAISVTERSCAAPISKVERHSIGQVLYHTFVQSVAEVNKQERGLDSTETEVKSEACGVGFSSLNPLSPPTALPRYSMLYYNTTCSSSVVAVPSYYTGQLGTKSYLVQYEDSLSRNYQNRLNICIIYFRVQLESF